MADRRSFLRDAALAGIAAVTPFEALARRGSNPDYGPLEPVRDDTTGLPLLLLPSGFRYRSFGWTGDPLSDGSPTPPSHDGMAAFEVGGGRVRLVRNHEVGAGRDAFPGAPAYDPRAGGGTTHLDFDAKRGTLLRGWASLSGTVRNCAGGPTPWGSWLTCEETLLGPAENNALTKPHGYVFEVPVRREAAAVPLVEMGRFSHEAVAVDPRTGYVYETEDAPGGSGFYRYVPRKKHELAAGGRLQMLALAGAPRADLTGGQRREPRPVEWVDIARPDPDDLAADGVFAQGFAAGGARFARLEGCWYGNKRVYLVSTSGGAAAQGQVFEYDPRASTLRLLFESPGAEVLSGPDNVCVSPRGGLVLCEDGGGNDSLFGLTRDGVLFEFARNNVTLSGERNGIVGDFRNAELAGATYSPDGDWLFFNVQSPGITIAVTGPWRKGAL
jgi:secreted PhoX family phosphatase